MTDFREVVVVCPECSGRFQDWIPRSDPVRVCVYCGTHVAHERLVEDGGVWTITPELRQVA